MLCSSANNIIYNKKVLFVILVLRCAARCPRYQSSASRAGGFAPRVGETLRGVVVEGEVFGLVGARLRLDSAGGEEGGEAGPRGGLIGRPHDSSVKGDPPAPGGADE